MEDDIKATVNLIVKFMVESPRRAQLFITEDQISRYGQCLQELMTKKFTGHWYPLAPLKGHGYRSIRWTEMTPDPLLTAAGKESGIALRQLRQLLPLEVTIWVDPSGISIRYGEEGSICELVKHEEVPVMKPCLNSSSPSCSPSAPRSPAQPSLSDPVWSGSSSPSEIKSSWTAELTDRQKDCPSASSSSGYSSIENPTGNNDSARSSPTSSLERSSSPSSSSQGSHMSYMSNGNGNVSSESSQESYESCSPVRPKTTSSASINSSFSDARNPSHQTPSNYIQLQPHLHSTDSENCGYAMKNMGAHLNTQPLQHLQSHVNGNISRQQVPLMNYGLAFSGHTPSTVGGNIHQAPILFTGPNLPNFLPPFALRPQKQLLHPHAPKPCFTSRNNSIPLLTGHPPHALFTPSAAAPLMPNMATIGCQHLAAIIH